MGDSFTNVFGGSTVQPSEVRYRLITLTGNVSLFWPQQGIDTQSVIAKWNNVNASADGFNITFPDATTIGPGEDAVFNNVAATTFNVLANDGTTIANISPGMAIYIINIDNSTVAGSWQVVTFGAGSSQAQASSLAGAGLLAAAGVLNLNIPVQSIGTNHTTVAADRATVLNWTGGAGTVTLTDPSAANFGNGWLAEIRNSGSGALTLSPSVGTIDGNSTKTINQTESAIVHTDGVNYYTVGYGRSVISTFTRLVISVAGSADVALTSAQAQNQVLEFTGALTGNINVTVPANVAEYFVFNNTTGAHTLTFKTVSGTGVVLTQGNRQITHCDGTNVVLSNSAGTGTVTAVTAGAGLAGGTITSTGTLSIANTAVTAGAYTSANITIGADGRITAAANGALGGSVISITAGAGLTGGTITTTGTIALPSSGVTPGSYVAPTITVDTYGRITAASSGAGSFLPITGGSLAGPGNLTVGGALTVTGATTAHSISATAILGSQLQVVSAGASPFLTTTSHHQWQLLSNTDNGFYLVDNTGGFTAFVVDSANHMTTSGNLTCNGNFNTNAISGASLNVGGTISGSSLNVGGGPVTCGNMTATGTVNTNAIVNNGNSTLVGTISCNAINSTNINTQGNTVTTANLSASGQVFCLNLVNTGSFSLGSGSIAGNLTVNGASFVCNAINSGAITATGSAINAGSITITGGAVKPGGGLWSAPSDERVKTVLGEYAKGLDAVLQLTPVTFVYKGNDTSTADGPSPHADVAAAAIPFVGLIAQKIEKIFPEMVSETAGFIDGQPVSDIRNVDNSSLVYALVNAVKELTARIEILEGK